MALGRRWVIREGWCHPEILVDTETMLDHLRVALAAAGWSTTVDRFPNPNNRDHLATVGAAPMAFVTDAHPRRADAILLRRTDRLPLAEPPGWESLEPALHAQVEDEGIYLDVLAGDARSQLAKASQLTDALRLYDSYFHAELNWWTAPFEATEGIPYSSLVSAAESER